MPDSPIDGSDHATDDPTDGAGDGATGELPEEVVADAERLTRLARGAVDEAEAEAYRRERDELLADHGYTARIRDEDPGEDDVLVCYPAEWIEEGEVRIDRIDDVDRGVERRLEGPGDGDWEEVAAENEAVVERVAANHDDPHAATARALADFANNHYAKPIAELTPAELDEFESEYFRRNAWPSERQVEAIEDSLALVFEEIDAASGDPP